MCARLKTNALNIASGDRVYVIGEKPVDTLTTSQTVTEGLNSYPVFTTSAL